MSAIIYDYYTEVKFDLMLTASGVACLGAAIAMRKTRTQVQSEFLKRHTSENTD